MFHCGSENQNLSVSIEHWVLKNVWVDLTYLQTARRQEEKVSSWVELRKPPLPEKRGKPINIQWLFKVQAAWRMHSKEKNSLV